MPTHFEDRLLDQLRQVVAERPASAPARRPVRRTRVALAGAGVVAAGAAIAIVSSSGDVTPSAYAVQPRADGSVTVHINDLSDAAGLQRSLRAAGVPAFVEYEPDGTLSECPAPARAEGGATTGVHGESARRTRSLDTQRGEGPGVAAASTVSSGPDGATFTVDPGELKPGEQLVVTTSAGTVSSIGMAVTERTAAPCSVQPPTPVPAPTGG